MQGGKKKKKKGRRRLVKVKLSKAVLVAPVRLHIHPLCLYCCVQGEHDTFLGDVAASYPPSTLCFHRQTSCGP